MTSSAVWMERLRSKSSQFKSLAEQSKSARTALLERRYGLDSEEKSAIRSCLDHLSEAIPVRDAVSMAERLEAIARKITSESAGSVSLSFMSAPVHGSYYLSTEMFYVEITIDSAGIVSEAKVHHIDATQQHQPPNNRNCPEIIECLSAGNFSRFVQHINGLLSVYSLPDASAADKTRAWTALTVLEQDLESIFNSYSSWQIDVSQLLHQTLLGLVEPRAGGIAMKLRYFMAPHELLDETSGKLLPYTVDNVVKHDLGHWVTIGIEKSDSPRLLPLRGLVATNKAGQLDMQASSNNSVTLPARFVMKLNRPMPMSLAKCREIAQLTEINFFDEASASPLIQLIVKNASNNKLDSANNRGLFVSLPGQQHCYFLSDHSNLKGILVSSIPFSLSRNVPDVLAILRQQALFNTVIASCVRKNSHQDLDKALVFEVSSLDLQHLTVTYEIVNEESMATVEFDLTNITSLRCNVYSANVTTSICPEELASKIIQKSLSLPITMRALIRHGQCRIKSDPEPEPEMTSLLNGNVRDPNQNFNSMDFSLSISNRHGNSGLNPADISIKSEPMDYETSSPYNNSSGNSRSADQDSLNAFGPQDATFHPEASAKSSDSSNADQQRGTSKDLKRSHYDDGKSSTTNFCPDIKIEGGLNVKSEVRKEPSKTSIAIKLPTISSAGAGRSSGGGYKPPQSSSSSAKSNHKSSVSILPVNSVDTHMTPVSSVKKQGGIEIIPLDVSPPDSLDSNSKNWNKEVRRSLSEDDKRKFERKDGSSGGMSGGGGSASKKRKPDPHFDRSSFGGHKKSGSPGSPNSKRPLFVGSGSDKSKSKQNMMGGKTSSTTTTSITSGSKIKFSTGIDGSTGASSTSVLEITPSSGSSSNPGSGANVSPPSSKSGFGSSSKDRSKSESPGLKLTIKNSSSGTGSSSSSSKHKSEHYHKSSSSGKSGGSSSSTSKSSSSSKQRSSSSSLQQKYPPTYKSSSSSPSSSSKHGSQGKSGRHDKDRERERERAEEVKRLLSGGKLNTTFQIPKLSSKSEETSPCLVVSSTTISSTSKSGYGQVTGSGIRGPTTSPKYPPSTVSPKYPPSSGSSSAVSPKLSPKNFLPGSTGALVSPKPPSSGVTGGENVTPPNISPKHSGSSAPSSSSKKTPSSSPTHGGIQSGGSSSSSNSTIKLPPPPMSFSSNQQSRNVTSSGQTSSQQHPSGAPPLLPSSSSSQRPSGGSSSSSDMMSKSGGRPMTEESS